MTVPVGLAIVWLASGIAAAVLVWRALRRPITDIDVRCSEIDAQLDASDYDDAIEDAADELVAEITAWLTARDKYERGLS